MKNRLLKRLNNRTFTMVIGGSKYVILTNWYGCVVRVHKYEYIDMISEMRVSYKDARDFLWSKEYIDVHREKYSNRKLRKMWAKRLINKIFKLPL